MTNLHMILLVSIILSGCYHTPTCQPMIGQYTMVYTQTEGDNCADIETRTVFFPPTYRQEDCYTEWSDDYDNCTAVLRYGCPYPDDLGSWEWVGSITNTRWSDTAEGEFTARWFDMQGVVKDTCKYTVKMERVNASTDMD